MTAKIVRLDDSRARPSNRELHAAASIAIQKSNHLVFESLPSVIAQLIEHKVWRDFEHKDFGSYALDATSNGLGVNTNQRLWILKCAMDVHGKHIKEWADVLQAVEKAVKLWAKEEGKTVRSFDGNSLEALAKDGGPCGPHITYLPSRQKHEDGHLLRLRKNNPDVFKRVVSGELSMVDARREAGMKVDKVTNLGRAQSAVRKMTAKERRALLDWMREQGWLS